MAEEAMEARPMSVADVAAGEDDLGDKAVALGEDPAGDDRDEGLVSGGGEDQGLRTRIRSLGALDKLGPPLLYGWAGRDANAFGSIDPQDNHTASGMSAP
jgi:hypothetical protein